MNPYLRKIKKIPAYLWETFNVIVFYPVASLIGKRKNIYLISERGTDARDNGYYMFKYIRRQHPELDCHYVIRKDSEDLDRVSKYGNVIAHGSLKHHIFYFASKYCISTHLFGYTPNIDFYARLIRRGMFARKKMVSLRHGVTVSDTPSLHAEKSKLDLVISSAKPEYDFMLENFHYHPDQLKYTGLARFDGLHEFTVKNQILVMPTWRSYLYQLNDREFTESEYYRRWTGFLENPALAQILKESDMKLVFYPHYELQKFIRSFQATSRQIIIADKEHYDVQELLKTSKLLITDFSSVFFDFAYMNKPCLYYQFDRERFYHEHYGKGYFDHTEMGFGEVCSEEDALICALTAYIRGGCEMKPVYSSRVADFFRLRDNHNCERIFDEIKKLAE